MKSGFPDGSDNKESACNAGDVVLIPGLGRSPGGGKGYPHQYSGLENSKDCIVHGVARSRTQLTNCHFTKPVNGHFLMIRQLNQQANYKKIVNICTQIIDSK